MTKYYDDFCSNVGTKGTHPEAPLSTCPGGPRVCQGRGRTPLVAVPRPSRAGLWNLNPLPQGLWCCFEEFGCSKAVHLPHHGLKLAPTTPGKCEVILGAQGG